MAIAAVSSIIAQREPASAERTLTVVDSFADLLMKTAAPASTPRSATVSERDRRSDDMRAAEREPAERSTRDAAEPSADKADRAAQAERPKDKLKEKVADKEKVEQPEKHEAADTQAAADTPAADDGADAQPSQQTTEAAPSEAQAAPQATQADDAATTETAAAAVVFAPIVVPETPLLLAPTMPTLTTTPAAASDAPVDPLAATPGGAAEPVESAPPSVGASAADNELVVNAAAESAENPVVSPAERFVLPGNRFGFSRNAGAHAAAASAPGHQAGQAAAATPSAAARQQSEALSAQVSEGTRVNVQVSRESVSVPTTQAAGGLVTLAAMMGESAGADAGTAGQGDGQPQAMIAQLLDAEATLTVTADAETDRFAVQLQAATATVANEAAPETPSNGASDQVHAVGGASHVGETAAAGRKEAVAAAAAPRAAAPPQPAEQIRVAVSQAIEEGKDRITMQLRPERLGHIEVKLEMGQDGRMTAAIAADNKDTLQMLQRDARDLQKALQDAGFNTDQRDLSFSLRQGREQGEQSAGRGGRGRRGGSETIEAPLAATGAPQRTAGRLGGVDISV